ncbi:MAG: hypothetical protein RLZZ272_1374 [Actinomycetota bacterium]
MTTTIEPPPTSRTVRPPSGSERRAFVLTSRILARLVVGTVELVAPDGSSRSHGDASSPLRARITVHDWAFFRRLVHGSSVGAGESYFLGEWDCDDLVTLVRIVIANRSAFRTITPSALLNVAGDLVWHALRSNRLGRSRRNIAEHYDLSNELYATFLDETMTYSCAHFSEPGLSLGQAQRAKWEMLARKVRLEPGLHVLEIGCGWGGFAIHAARQHGCRVTGITLSERQAEWARRAVEEAGVADRVDIRLVDYREVEGSYDRIVSIEMLEAVGHRYLGTYFAALDRLLAPDGIAAVQVITIPEQRERAYRRRPDYIQRYVFPGGYLPSLASMTTAMGRDSRLFVQDVEDLSTHYAETLRQWRERFLSEHERVLALGFDERFVRRWEFYLAYCEGAFLARYLGDLQLVLARPMNANLGTAPYAGPHVALGEADVDAAMSREGR